MMAASAHRQAAVAPAPVKRVLRLGTGLACLTRACGALLQTGCFSRGQRRLAQTLCLCVLTGAAWAQSPAPAVQAEVEQLFTALQQSRCEFQRNGSWYDSAKAAEHLRGKYDYLLKKGWVVTPDDFIARAGTESSMSHKPYQVRCPGQAEQPSATWLQAELKRYRSK